MPRRPVPSSTRSGNGVTVLEHERNQGKGAALKTGIAHAVERFPDTNGIITVDADGQHLPEDVRKAI
ncbi:glycosyltransferase [Bacillus sp. P14.5]|uniref:glycosyltransferase n=1 Tax=Bacillus sp. P14.5 TaxID=1983400 RepID=UPI001F06E74F|nr:glycosyltransferase [Bacillus sp. P14.5]